MERERGARGRTDTERRQRAIELRAAGATYKAIAQELGISVQGAHQLVRRALAAPTPPSTDPEARAAERALEEARLRAIEESLWRRRGEPATAKVLVELLARRRALRGLDAPVEAPPAAVPNAPVDAEEDLDAYDLDALDIGELRQLRSLLEKAKRGRLIHLVPLPPPEPDAAAVVDATADAAPVLQAPLPAAPVPAPGSDGALAASAAPDADTAAAPAEPVAEAVAKPGEAARTSDPPWSPIQWRNPYDVSGDW